MGSMTDVYGSLPFNLTRHQRRNLGRIILSVSALLFATSVFAATTDLLHLIGLNKWQSRELAGIVGGLAAPFTISGLLLLLPAARTERQLAGIGCGLAFIGVLLFWSAYPQDWAGYGQDHTFRAVAVYFIGIFTAFSAVFFAVSNVKIRNPGGAILRTIKSEAQNVLEKPAEKPPEPVKNTQNSSVGFMGGIPSDMPNDPSRTDDAEFIDPDPEQRPPRMIDEYCGNCEHFQYRRVGNELQPHCGLHDELMDDLEACDDWSASTDV